MSNSPLAGKRIVITRAEEQAGELASQLRALGATPIIYPAIAIAPPADIAPLDAAIAQIAMYDWLIVTSANAVRAFIDWMVKCGGDIATLQHVRIGAVGPATARVLREYGLEPQFTPSIATAEAIVAEIGDVAGLHIVFPCADIARETLPHGLRERGARVDEVIAYRTVPGAGVRTLLAELQRGTVDAVTLFSPSAVRYMLDGLTQAHAHRASPRDVLKRTTLVCIGPTTAAAAEHAGLRVDVIAREHTSAGLIATLIAWFGKPSSHDNSKEKI